MKRVPNTGVLKKEAWDGPPPKKKLSTLCVCPPYRPVSTLCPPLQKRQKIIHPSTTFWVQLHAATCYVNKGQPKNPMYQKCV